VQNPLEHEFAHSLLVVQLAPADFRQVVPLHLVLAQLALLALPLLPIHVPPSGTLQVPLRLVVFQPEQYVAVVPPQFAFATACVEP
jgi:hypothetical protein